MSIRRQVRVRTRVRVTGRVQGVGYRYTCRREAETRGVAGWVTNLDDGSVEAVFEGDSRSVEDMIDWSRRGPSGASVASVDVQEEEPTGEAQFRVV